MSGILLLKYSKNINSDKTSTTFVTLVFFDDDVIVDDDDDDDNNDVGVDGDGGDDG